MLFFDISRLGQMVHVVLCWLWCYMMTIMLSFLPFHNNRQQTFQIVQGDDCSAGWCLWWIGPKIFFDATWWHMMTLMRCCTFQNMHVLHSTYTQISKVFKEAVSKTIVKPKSKSKSKLRVGRTQSKKNWNFIPPPLLVKFKNLNL